MWALIGFFASITNTYAANYYQSPCLADETMHPGLRQKTIPAEILDHLPFQNQGATHSCGPHAAMDALNVLAKSQQLDHPGYDLWGALQSCPARLVGSDFSAYPIEFLLHLRQNGPFIPHTKTVAEHMCDQPSIEFPEVDAAIASVTPLLQTLLPPPQFRIKTWDSFRDPQDMQSVVLQHFGFPEGPDAIQSLILDTCYSDDGSPKFHAINLVGIEEVICTKNNVSRNVLAGIFRNSWGNQIETYNLEEILIGMIRHKRPIINLAPCEHDCLGSPFLAHDKAHSYPHIHYLKQVEKIDPLQFEELLAAGSSVNSADSKGYTALFLAVENRNPIIVRLLLQYGADTNLGTPAGNTPLTEAVSNGDYEITQMLLRTADINAQNEDGDTPLMIAIRRGDVQSAQLLLKHRAQITDHMMEVAEEEAIGPIGREDSEKILKMLGRFRKVRTQAQRPIIGRKHKREDLEKDPPEKKGHQL